MRQTDTPGPPARWGSVWSPPVPAPRIRSTGIATAYMDSIPMVVFTGQVPTPLIGNDAFQEVDIVGITRPCTKHNYLVKDVDDLARVIKEAFYIARTGRPGPVLVDLPKDVVQAKTTPKLSGQGPDGRAITPTTEAIPGQIKRPLEMILKSPTAGDLCRGRGNSLQGFRGTAQVRRQILQIPVTTTLMGLGGFPATHPLWLGMLGMHGTYWANMAVHHSDVLIAIGARFDDRVTGKMEEFAPKAKIIHIDIDPTSISKNVGVDIPIVGDCQDALSKLNALMVEETPRKT